MTNFAKGKADIEKVFQDGYVEQFLSQTLAQNNTRLDALPPSIPNIINELQLIEAILLVTFKKFLP
jgi:hypothetical protein